MIIAKPVNDTQRNFNRLCELGGGTGGGPARTRLQDLLCDVGKRATASAAEAISEHFNAVEGANPWYVCFVIGLSWGRLARFDVKFTEAGVNLLYNWNDADRRAALSFANERGPDPIEQSLKGGLTLFNTVTLPDELPNDLRRYRRAQERWLSSVIAGPNRPRYIGSWNATAMFMIALLANPALTTGFTTPVVLLPPGGPIYAGLSILHRAHVLAQPPSGTELDDEAFEPGALYENNALFEEILRGRLDWSLLDVHSALYMLGTRLTETDGWF